MILGVGNDVQDALIRQTIGLQPYISLPRINDVPVQWVQLLNGFDQQDLYGWPLPTPLKVQIHKCDKCSREFCSTVNYRRHIRVHRRLNVDKESYKNRDSLGAFWDKVSLDEAKNILSFEDVMLEGVPGSSIIKALASFVRAPGFCALPQVYVKAGCVLMDVIEATPSRLPISSQDFFAVLDDASENTFLCGGSAGSVPKFIFDGEAGKVGLEMKNLAACTSFLIEQNLVKAWIADKDAEALRCQKLLVEEEEAAQRRQAELLERKRLRKLRQKEQKSKGRPYKETTKLTVAADILEIVPYTESSSPPQSAGDLHALEDHNYSTLESVHVFNNEVNGHIDIEGGYDGVLDISRGKNVDSPESQGNNSWYIVGSKSKVLESMSEHIEIEGGYNSELLDIGRAKIVELTESQGNNNQHIVDSKSQVLKSTSEQNACDLGLNLDVVQPDTMQKHSPPMDLRIAPVNSSEIGNRKDTVENGGESVTAMLHEEKISQTDSISKLQVLESTGEQNALDLSLSLDVVKSDPMQKHSLPMDSRVAPVNSSEIGSREGTVENGRESVTAMLHEGEISQTDSTSCEVMIGSISVTVRNCIMQKQHDDSQSESLLESCSIDHVTCGNIGAPTKQIKPESTMDDTSLSNDRWWRHEVESQFVAQSVAQSGVTGVGTMLGKCSLGFAEVGNDSKHNDFIQPANLALSTHSARAFLVQRWKEAILGDHETLVLAQEARSQGHCDATNGAENHLDIMEAVEYPTNRPADDKLSRKAKKGYLIKVKC